MASLSGGRDGVGLIPELSASDDGAAGKKARGSPNRAEARGLTV